MDGSNIFPLHEPLWVIGVGASAGGLEALTLFVAHLPPEFSGAIVIAQHLAPHAKSMMVELLQRHANRPVIAASHEEKIEAKTIYIVPPNHDIDLVDGKIYLTVAGHETRPKPSVDAFFESLARAYGARAVGIILSGTGSDGSEGIQAIKAAGGITLAQDDVSAKYDGMPKAAVNTGDIDSILPPEQIAKNLPRLLQEHTQRIDSDQMDDSGLKKILRLIRDSQGTDFRQYKLSTIQRRALKRMAQVGLRNYDDYYEMLKKTPGEIAQFAQEMLVSVTSFFRDAEVFEALGEAVNKIVAQKKVSDELRIWAAGCATGEEAYTLAILFSESLQRQHKNLVMKVFASDLDQDAILEARSGFYTDKECEKIPTDFLQKYFERRDGGYEVSKRLREIVVFARQDMTQNPPFVKLDLISCRNVLIYFDPELQKKVVEIFHYALNPSGILLLGRSETVPVMTNLFKTLDRSSKIFAKLNVPSRPLPHAKPSRMIPLPALRAKAGTGPSLAEVSYLRLLNSCGISGVTIDEDCTILQVIGDVSPYLGFFTPQPDFRLTNLLPKGVGIEIPLLIRKALKEGGTHRSRLFKREKTSKLDAFAIAVRALHEDEDDIDGKKLFVVNFEPKKKREQNLAVITPEGELPERVSELEQELFVTREHLQTVIEELGVSNEELQSLNEELSSTNEELQASSEELETTNEELQSSNEELTTLNEELSTKQSELRQLNVSFENVQNSIGSPLIILDAANRIVRYNPEALKLFALTPADIGREILRVSSSFEVENFADLIHSAVMEGVSSEIQVEVGSIIYQLRVLPCLDEHKSITGAILVFFDNTESLRNQEKLVQSDQRMRAIINGADSIVTLKDPVGRYLLANEAFEKFYNLTEKQILGKTDRELFTENIAVPLRESDLEVLVKRSPHKSPETRFNPAGEKRIFVSSRFPLLDTNRQQAYAVGTVSVDITAQVLAQEELRQSQQRYRAIVEDQAVFVARQAKDGKLTYVNAPFVNQFAGSRDMEGLPFETIVAPGDKSRVHDTIAQISPQTPIVQYEHRVAGTAQSPRWVRWIHRGILNEKNEVAEYQAVGFDVTESRQKTDLLLERDTVYRGVFDHTIDFLSVYKVEGSEFILESFNRSTARALGLGQSQLVGRRLQDISDSRHVNEILGRYRACVATKQSQVFDEQVELPGGIKYFSTTLVPIPGPDGQIERIAATSRDVSSHKHIEQDLRRAKEDADLANRAKSDFLASMSHELRTPLNVVLGMSELLTESNLNEEQASFSRSIHRSGMLLLNLIEDILDVAKIEAGKVTLNAVNFSPAEVVHEVIDLFKLPASDKKIELRHEVNAAAAHIVVGDPTRLRQVMVNLMSNALKFTDRGSVTLKAHAEIHQDNHESIFEFSVTDTGIGIAEEAHKRLFQRFSQVDSGNSRKYGGSGLGLMISKQLISLMGGTIQVQSATGQGSTFRVRVALPLSRNQRIGNKAAEAKVLEGRPAEKIEAQSALKILAIDDNPDSRYLIGQILKKLGHETDLAESAQAALDKIKKDDFDIVLMDIQMPDMNGYEATAAIRNFPEPKSKLPIVALTANAMAGDAEKAFKAGMDDYLSKPVDLEALRSLLKRWSVRIQTQQ